MTEKIRNYNRRYREEYGFWRKAFYFTFMYLVVIPFMAIFYDYKITGKENLPKTSRLLFTANHVSHFDPPMISWACHRLVAYMAKKELFVKGNKFEWLVKRLGAFAVDRTKPEIATFKTVKDIMTTSWSLGVFPQGGVRPYGSDISDLKKGFVVIAKNAKADIIPISIANFSGYPKIKPFTRRTVELHIGKPISYKLDEDEIIKQWCEHIMKYADYTCSLTAGEKVEV
ncbi:1-acyl-sn-glycerol-3-phosphate acyltransferase [bacterium]|nr:1-acyl-sn-glycerol-3-phosphate acyltransferase [bacterium]